MSGWIAGSIAVAAVVGAVASNKAAKKAAEGSKEAARIAAEGQDKALDWQKEESQWQKDIYEDYKPFLMGGLEGYEGLLKDPESYKQSPGYLFRLQEGLKAIGIPDGGSPYLSGSQIKAATRYAEDYATSDYDRELMRYANMAGLAGQAQQTGTTVAAAGAGVPSTYMQGAAMQGQYIQNAANARASGYIGASSALTQGAQNYALYDAYKNPNAPVSGG